MWSLLELIFIHDSKIIRQDGQVQSYCHSLGYNKVIVYASNGKVRNNVGNWAVEKVIVGADKKGFDFYAAKDEAMAREADYGFMIWNGKSRGTHNNMYNLVKLNKTVSLPNSR